MAVPNYKPFPRPKIETRIVSGKSARVETLFGKIIRVYDDNNNLIEDRTVSLGIDSPPLLKPKIVPSREIKQEAQSSQEAKQDIDDNLTTEDKNDKRGEIDDDPILKIPSFSNTKTENIIPDANLNISKIDQESDSQKLEEPKNTTTTTSIQTVTSTQIPTQIPSPISTDIRTDPPGQDTIKDTAPIPQNNPQNTDIKDLQKTESPIIDTDKILKDTIKDISTTIKEDKLPNKSNGITIFSQRFKPIFEKINKAEENMEGNNIENVSKNIGTDKDIDNPQKDIGNSTQKDIVKTENIPRIKHEDNIPIDEKTDDNDKIITSEHGKEKAKQDYISKEDKSMAEEVLEEYKRNKWAEERDYKKSIEDMARTSLDNKEKIADISEKIATVDGKLSENKDKIDKIIDVDEKVVSLQENLKEKFGVLQNLQEHLQEHLKEKLGDIKRPVSDTLGELCTGIDCIKEDIKKNQDSSSELEKKMDSRFTEIRDRIQRLEVPTYVCDNCGYDELRPLSSFCPNCGTPVYGWSDPETGNPVAGWAPYWKRGQRAKSPE